MLEIEELETHASDIVGGKQKIETFEE